MPRWERRERGEVARWEVPGFIQSGGYRISPGFHLFANFLYWRVDVFQVLSKINYNKIVSSTYYILIGTNNGKLYSVLKFQYVIYTVMSPQKPKIIVTCNFSTQLSKISSHLFFIVTFISIA